MKDIKTILESKPKYEDYNCQPYGYINALQNYIDKIEEAINYSQCCETLKCKEETAFELWLKNFEESDGCYWFDKETLYVKQAMKEIYEKEVKPKL